MDPDSSVTSGLQAVIERVVEADGYDLEEVTVTPAGKRRVLRVLVDRDGGVDLDAVADVTRALSKELDASDAMGSRPYTLEVSSPGATRPLTLPRHWRRNVGRLIEVKVAGDKLVGRLRSCDDEGADLEVDGSPCRISYADMGRARVQLEFKPRKDTGTDTEKHTSTTTSTDVTDGSDAPSGKDA